MNKKGLSVFGMFLWLFVIFFAALMLGITMWGYSLVNDVFNQDIDVGQVNLATINNQTFGALNTAFISQGDTIGIIILLTMTLLLMINAYFTGREYPKLFLVVDLLIIVFVFIVSVYISQVYSIFINSSDLLSAIFVDEIPNTSSFVLNLPIIVGTVGALIMILTYSGLKKKDEEPQVLGY